MEQKQTRKIVKCPICPKPSSTEDFPFCSNRCRQVDLHRWFSGAYVIPGEDHGYVRDDDAALRPSEEAED